ncbi:hypothetical protein BH11PSE8_BH11PSE8_30290 [soil metagenome]
MKRPLLRWPAIDAPRDGAPLLPLRQRLMWMVIIWAGSVGALLAVATLLRWVLKA